MLDAGAKARLAGTRFPSVDWRAEVASTNDEVMAMARAGATEAAVVVADHQSAGRGRRGRAWEAPPGSSLLVSVLLRAPAAPLAPMAAGLAAVDACRVAAGVEARLKWPNDVVVETPPAKLGGILAEASGESVVVGLGVNVDWRGHRLPAGAVDLATRAGWSVDRRELLVAYLRSLDGWCQQEPPAVLAAYRATCATLGRPVRLALPGGAAVTGMANDVDDGGRLVVDDRPFAAGDVAHLR